MPKLQTEIVWWFPGRFRIAYKGTPKTRWEWISGTWRAYLGMWQVALRVAWLTGSLRLTRTKLPNLLKRNDYLIPPCVPSDMPLEQLLRDEDFPCLQESGDNE